MPKKIGIMISGGGTNMQAIVNACKKGNVDAEVAFIGTDNPKANGLVWARGQNIPIFVVNYSEKMMAAKHWRENDVWLAREKDYLGTYSKSQFVHSWFDGQTRRQQDYIRQKMSAEYYVLEKIKEYNIDLLVLAGFMQVCTAYLIDAVNKDSYDPRIMNIHPALLPSFPGIDGYGDTIRYGCKVGGTTVHFVDYGEDTGPIIGQTSINVLPEDTVDSFRERGLQEEYKLFPECINLWAEGRLKVEDIEQRNGLMKKVVKIMN